MAEKPRKMIENIHLGILNRQVHLQFTYTDGAIENFLFDLPIARRMLDAMGQVVEAIEASGVPGESLRVSEQAVVRLVGGGYENAEQN